MTLAQAIERSETDARIDARPLAIAGGAGDDAIYGDGTNSVIFGGDGSDTIVGGAGDNIIFADGDDGHAFQFSSFGMGGENDVANGQVKSFKIRIKIASMQKDRSSLGAALEVETYFEATINPLISVDFSDLMRMHGDDVRAYVDGYAYYSGYGTLHSAAL
ncbi:hypothetical protein LBW62_25910, partial [Ralstonia solanacearum]|nr:hypothetical protein [Ralstonia solanacearum]MDB0559593.1 hypothetical protein [Ralstonia solanacearum]